MLVDTGALIALYNSKDPHHRSCVATAQLLPVGKAYTCWPVVTEAVYLLRNHPGQRMSLLRAIHRGEFGLLSLTSDDLPAIDVSLRGIKIKTWIGRRGARPLGKSRADRHRFSTDRRHFSVYRRADGTAFRVLPEPS